MLVQTDSCKSMSSASKCVLAEKRDVVCVSPVPGLPYHYMIIMAKINPDKNTSPYLWKKLNAISQVHLYSVYFV